MKDTRLYAKNPTKSDNPRAYEGASFRCQVCEERIEDEGTSAYPGDCPIIIRLVVGAAPLHPTVGGVGANVEGFAMPQIVRDVLTYAEGRMIFCPECFAETAGLPMLDKSGKPAKTRAEIAAEEAA